MLKFAILSVSALALSGCAMPLLNSPGGQMSQRGPNDGACAGVSVNPSGGGSIVLMPPGAVGKVTATPTTCTLEVDGWAFIPPAAVPITVPAPAPQILPPSIVPKTLQ